MSLDCSVSQPFWAHGTPIRKKKLSTHRSVKKIKKYCLGYFKIWRHTYMKIPRHTGWELLLYCLKPRLTFLEQIIMCCLFSRSFSNLTVSSKHLLDFKISAIRTTLMHLNELGTVIKNYRIITNLWIYLKYNSILWYKNQ